MLTGRDHPLNEEGIQQCVEFNNRWHNYEQEPRSGGPMEEDFAARFFHAEVGPPSCFPFPLPFPFPCSFIFIGASLSHFFFFSPVSNKQLRVSPFSRVKQTVACESFLPKTFLKQFVIDQECTVAWFCLPYYV
jgi:hypothetical protein